MVTLFVVSFLGVIVGVATLLVLACRAAPPRPDSKPGHVAPMYYGYRGGWDRITRCEDCGRIALEDDQHPVNPCHACGGEVWRHGVGKWVFDHWHVRQPKNLTCNVSEGV